MKFLKIFDKGLYKLRRGTAAGFAALAVGTTTYTDEYWKGLEQYLTQHDPLKLPFVDRRGEDIDIVLCSEACDVETLLKYWLDCTQKGFREAGFLYEFNPRSMSCGRTYLSVPPEHKQKHQGQPVLILKETIEYGVPNFTICFSKTRDFHLIFRTGQCAHQKIQTDIYFGLTFSVLFRQSNIQDLKQAIELVESKEYPYDI